MHNDRIKILLSIIIALLSILIFRLAYVQIFEGSKYSGISDKRRIKRQPSDALRGKIFDINGIALATNRHTFNISAQYKDLLYHHLQSTNKLLPRLKKLKAHKKSFTSCNECHQKQHEQFQKLIKITNVNPDTIFQRTKVIIDKVERIKKSVSTRKGKNIIIVEELSLHPLIKDVPFESVATLELYKKEFPNIHVEVKPHRWYPYGSLAAHIIGYTGELKGCEWEKYRFKKPPFECEEYESKKWYEQVTKSPMQNACEKIEEKKRSLDSILSSRYSGYVWAGKTGIEAFYNLSLLGKPGEIFQEVTVGNSEVNKVIIEQPSQAGENIHLTINGGIQMLAEEALGNRTGSITVMDPWSGAIIAMATSPGFNLNTFGKDFPKIIKDKKKPLLNRPIQSTLPPGSTFKIVTSIAGLAEGIITKNTKLHCYGHSSTTQNRFRCSSKFGHGMIDIKKAIEHSCNVYFFKASRKIGAELWYKWAEKFGFGSYCNIDLPYERRGLLPKPKSSLELMNVAIGQGNLLVSPLQITRMMAIIANGGYNIKPHLLHKIIDYSGNIVVQSEKKLKGQPFIPKNALEIVRQGLVNVVISGTARKIDIKNYLVAGKTGTAEIKKDGNNHAWFAGFAPHNNPKYSFTVHIENTPLHAAEATGPILRKLLEGLFPEMVE